jgi:hypothetical protein
MVADENAGAEHIAQSAVELHGIQSAALFVLRPGSSVLELAAAAGIDGQALERLVDAVRNPQHPVSRTLADAVASYDVRPTAPGGPALRSHLPLLDPGADRLRATGVLAVAHEESLPTATRGTLERLASAAATLQH